MVDHWMVRFEPINITCNKEDFVDLYEKIRKIINSVYSDDHQEVIPSIRKIYPVNEIGFPLNPEA